MKIFTALLLVAKRGFDSFRARLATSFTETCPFEWMSHKLTLRVIYRMQDKLQHNLPRATVKAAYGKPATQGKAEQNNVFLPDTDLLLVHSLHTLSS